MARETFPEIGIQIQQNADGEIRMLTTGEPSPVEMAALAEFGLMWSKMEVTNQIITVRTPTDGQ